MSLELHLELEAPSRLQPGTERTANIMILYILIGVVDLACLSPNLAIFYNAMAAKLLAVFNTCFSNLQGRTYIINL